MSAIPAKGDCGLSDSEQFYSKSQPATREHRVRLRPYGLGWPTTFSEGRSPVGGGNGGHVEMPETLISTRLLEVISNRAAGNGRSPGEPPFSDVQGHFREHDGPGQLDGGCLFGMRRTSNEAPAVVCYPTEPPLSLGIAPHTEQSAFNQHQDPKWYNPAMCGRFYLTASPAELKKMFKVDYLPELVPRYNIAPAQLSPIVIPVEKGRSIHMARWGLVPSWSRDLSLGVGMINAPVETLDEKPAYRTAFAAQRCLVPASGFYEWQNKGVKNQPYRISLRNGALIAFAGLWERWAPENGEPVETFAIITTQATKLVNEVHDRMPAIIAPADYRSWLKASANTAKKLLVPYISGMTIAPVGDRVSNVKNDDAELLRPVVMS